jgi:hypothetical protein
MVYMGGMLALNDRLFYLHIERVNVLYGMHNNYKCVYVNSIRLKLGVNL